MVPVAALSGAVLAESAIRVAGVVGSLLYGGDGDVLYNSANWGESWSLVQDTNRGNQILGIFALPDGEVFLTTFGGAWKSSGWVADPTTATWTQKITPHDGANIIQGGFDVYGGIAIVCEYANPRTPSKSVWLSVDSAESFAEVLNLDDLYPGVDPADVHWHSVCIDPWNDNRLWASHGDITRGIYYSDDQGENWILLTDAELPTVMVAIPAGIVCGSDDIPNGLALIANSAVTQIYTISIESYGFARRGWRDPDSNLAFVAFQTNIVAIPGLILVSDGRCGTELYRAGASCDVNQVVTAAGKLAAYVEDTGTGTKYLLAGDIA